MPQMKSRAKDEYFEVNELQQLAREVAQKCKVPMREAEAALLQTPNTRSTAMRKQMAVEFLDLHAANDGIEPIPVDDQVLGEGAVGDRDLKPIPVDDTEWNDPKARGPYKLTTSAALKTPAEVSYAYGKKDPEGFKKTFGKDAEALRPIPVNPAPMAKLIPVSKAKHVKDSDDDDDLRDALKVLDLCKGRGTPVSPQGIANVTGFSLSFVKDVMSGKYGTTRKEIAAAFKAGAKDEGLEPIPVGDAHPAIEKYNAARQREDEEKLKREGSAWNREHHPEKKAKDAEVPANDCCYFVTS